MNFNGFNNNMKINGVKSYTTKQLNVDNVFKNTTDNGLEEINYNNYEALDSNISIESNNSNFMNDRINQNRHIIDEANELLNSIRNRLMLYSGISLISPIVGISSILIGATMDGFPKVTISNGILQIERDNIIYRYRDGSCYEIEYENGVVAEMTYDSNRELNGLNYYYNNNGEREPLSIFGDNNIQTDQYGGDQMYFSEYSQELLQDPIILDMLRDTYPDVSMEDYELYLNSLCSVGCGYVAFINMVFQYFEGREEEFESTFGFPMYEVDEHGNVDYNYEYLILDLFNYIWGNSGYTIEELYGNTSENAIDGALDTTITTKVVTGTSTADTDYYNNPDISSYTTCIQYLFYEYGILDIEREYYDKNDFPTVLEYGTEEYIAKMEELRLDPEVGDRSPLIIKEFSVSAFLDFVKQQLQLENAVVISIGNFDMHYLNGKLYAEDIGGHAMTITGVTDEGLIVSSWGGQFLIKIEEIEKIWNIQVFDLPSNT